MDLCSITPSTIAVKIKHPGTGEPTGLVLQCVSFQDDRVKRAQRDIANKIIRLGRNKSQTAEQVEENTVRLLSAAVVGWNWDGDASWGGQKLDFTPENVRKVLAPDWLRKQVDEALGDEQDFFAS